MYTAVKWSEVPPEVDAEVRRVEEEVARSEVLVGKVVVRGGKLEDVLLNIRGSVLYYFWRDGAFIIYTYPCEGGVNVPIDEVVRENPNVYFRVFHRVVKVGKFMFLIELWVGSKPEVQDQNARVRKFGEYRYVITYAYREV